MSATIKDIATKIGVAPSTVSRALNNKGRVSEKTRRRILEAVRELGYRPNMSARGLALNKTENIGFIVNRRQNLTVPSSFYGRIMEGAEAEARKYRHHLIFSTVDEKEVTLPRMIREKRVDGLIIAGCDINKQLILGLKEKKIPLVLVDNHMDGEKISCVVTDNVNGAYEAVKHLINLGHKRIGFVAERLSDLSFAERFEGYRLALKGHELEYDEDLVEEGVIREGCGYIAMKKLLENRQRVPTAVFAANDFTSVGAMKAIKEKGLKIPDDIAIVGFDDGVEFALHTEPPLTTVRVFREKMGQIAVNILIEAIKNQDQPPAKVVLSTELMVRESCGGKR